MSDDNSGKLLGFGNKLIGHRDPHLLRRLHRLRRSRNGLRELPYGGLDIDKNGNLVAISAFTSQMYVYSGCDPACTLVGGPFSMQGEAVFGHLNKQSMTFCAGDFSTAGMDVYYYSPSALTYWYSFNNGLCPASNPKAARTTRVRRSNQNIRFVRTLTKRMAGQPVILFQLQTLQVRRESDGDRGLERPAPGQPDRHRRNMITRIDLR